MGYINPCFFFFLVQGWRMLTWVEKISQMKTLRRNEAGQNFQLPPSLVGRIRMIAFYTNQERSLTTRLV